MTRALVRVVYPARSTQRSSAGWGLGIALLFCIAVNCGREPVGEPVTLTFIHQRSANFPFQQEYERELQQFTKETGIRVKFLPHPEITSAQMELWRKLLAAGPAGADVYSIDVIWPGLLSEYFIDLKPYFANELSAYFPAILNSYFVGDKLVAIPYGPDIGLFFYRTDLLEKYGYRAPPATWSELETMAARIQSGERAKGRKNFWGYVWQGAPTEALTCDALEWQASEGGGWIVEADQTISVNNPQAIRSWQRAAHWVGSISPPSVTSFNEEDTLNVWLDGDAAFMRTWPPAYGISQVSSSQVRNKFNVALLPGGRAGQFGTLGGIALAVSRSSAHPREALELVRFLSRRDVELQLSHAIGEAPVRSELYELPELLAPNPQFALLGRAFGSAAVSRPSNVTGKKYEEVSDAYQRAVNSVLTHKKTAPDAAATLERELVRITGFRTGPPSLSERLAREGH